MSKEDKGKVRMTVIHFETESDNATLQANIHAIAQTLSRALAPPVKFIPPAQLAPGNGNGGSPDEMTVDSEDEAIDVDFTPTTSKNKGKSSGNAAKPRSPTVLELDLTSGDLPLQTFFDEKKPEGENKKYLTIAYWFKENRNMPEVTMDHIHTAYRFLKLNTPKDASKPLRNLKGQGWMAKGKDTGAYAINHIGENEVNDLG